MSLEERFLDTPVNAGLLKSPERPIITMSEEQLEQATFDSLWDWECPSCGGGGQAEPDAQSSCCGDCGIMVDINNPWF